MPKKEKRFPILLTEEEQILLNKEANIRGISQAELLRLAFAKEIRADKEKEKIKALQQLIGLFQ